ncbi:MAG: hypothetical protein ACP5VN_01425 [Acidobacteriota bacterium]
MKKTAVLILGAVLVLLLASCDLSNLFKPKPPAEETNQPANDVVPPPPAGTQPGGTTTTRPPSTSTGKPPYGTPAQGTTTPSTTTPPPATTQPQNPVTPPKDEHAFLGVIFVTDMQAGAFKVKTDKETLMDHSFSGKHVRVTRELKVPAGSQTLKFIVFNDKGVRGIRTLDVNYKPKSHHTIRVVNKKSPGNIVLEVLE